MKKLKIDHINGMFMGVCAGISNTLNIDPTLVRVGVAVLAFVFPITGLIYIGLGFIIPD